MISDSGTNVAKVIEKDQDKDLRGQLKHFMKLTGMSDVVIARALRRQVAVIIKYLSAQPMPYTKGLDEDIAEFLGVESQWRLMPTENLTMVFDMCRYAKRRKRVAALSGRSGYGKTTALKLFARTEGAIYYCYDETSGYRDVIMDILQRLGVPDARTITVGRLRRSLVKEIKKQKNPLLIIDQADTLPFKAIECLRTVHDETGCPIMLSGLSGRLLDRLKRRNARENAEQVFSRIAAYINLPKPTESDVQEICLNFNIDGIRAQDFVNSRAAVGGYRAVRMLCEDASDIAKENSLRKINLACLKKAAEYLITTIDD